MHPRQNTILESCIMAQQELVLSFTIRDEHTYYWVIRDGRIVYVDVENAAPIPGHDPVAGPPSIEVLQKLDRWHEPWAAYYVTLRDGDTLHCEPVFTPKQGILPELLRDNYPRINRAALPVVQQLKRRIQLVLHDGQQCFLKYARFTHELLWLEHEMRVFNAVEEAGVASVILAYVYDKTPDRIVGICMEKFKNDGPLDYVKCTLALDQIHANFGLNIPNMDMGGDGPMFFDFEDLPFDEDEGDDVMVSAEMADPIWRLEEESMG